jgi:hypothetical protein
VEVRQGAEERYRPELYVVGDVQEAVRRRVESWQDRWPGVGCEETGRTVRVTIPDSYRVGHEAHFAQVARQFFGYLEDPASLPAWEKANMLAKYYTTTAGVRLARSSL